MPTTNFANFAQSTIRYYMKISGFTRKKQLNAKQMLHKILPNN